ncbi:hypothetical protein [Streptomyces olivaceus]
MSAKWPERVKLPRGRHTHAVGYAVGHSDRVTACDRNAEAGDFLPDNAPVTCPACRRTTEE